ncbi:hypothetical protein QBC35DRAFT_434461 [Podospora australis]|uniref:Zn(2)-C6 fungal-type domain-containing protein n=1 Tax=Podospora australis TaxID=1536484 RepID=A0AAN7AJC4_9PEZI|nr:hypothetical protein QBC35DRAFT_434461 [Podospora australis]
MSQQSDQVPNYEQNETQAFPGAAGPRRGRRSTTPVASYTADQRLAGNPRKQKVPPESRKRVVRACNNCNVRKGRCSGETPCRQCSISGRECIYSPPPDLIKVPQADYEALQKEKAEHEALRKEVAELKRQLELTRDSHAGPLTPPADTSPPSQLSNDALALSNDGRMLSDGSGSRVYQGRSSGAIFLDKLKMVIAVAMPLAGAVGKADEPSPGSGFVRSVGSYQTGDSKPFDLSRIEEPAELIPPPPEEEVNQARWDIRTFLGDGNCSYQCGGVLYWPLTAADRGRLRPSKTSLDYILDSPEERVGEKVKEGNPMALSYMALALGTVLKLAGPGSKASGRLGEDSFARAWKHLADPTQLTKSSLDDIASMALVAIYLVENNRRDGAYCWVSAALATCEKRGMHTRTLYRESDEVEVRVFWTVYLLEKWLSCLLGRPTMLQLNDVSAPMPDIRPADFIRHAAKYLNHWLKCLPKEMRLGEDPVAITLPDFTGWAEPRQVYCLGNDRAKWALHMSYNQLIILSIRPAFLVAVQKAIASIMCEDGPWWFEGHTMSREFYRCTEAATRNIRLGWLMRLYSPYRKLMVADLHHIFNATVVLLMHQMVFVNQTTQFRTDVNWAINQVFEVEAATGCEYAMDCLAVLKDLHFIALRLRNVIFEPYDRDEAWSPNGVLREFITHRERADSGTCNYVFPRLPIEAMARFEAWEVLSEWRNLDLEDGACYRSFFY